MGAVSIGTATESVLIGEFNADIRSGSQSYQHDLKFGFIELADTTDASDTCTVDLYQQFGIKRLLGIKGWKHTTNESVVTTENPTCTVDNGSCVITVPAGSDNDKRVYMLVGV